jgi:hypothetical protein
LLRRMSLLVAVLAENLICTDCLFPDTYVRQYS